MPETQTPNTPDTLPADFFQSQAPQTTQGQTPSHAPDTLPADFFSNPKNTVAGSIPEQSTQPKYGDTPGQTQDFLTNTESGISEAAQDVWGTVKNMVSHPVDTLTSGGLVGATKQAYESIKDSIPILHAYENARSSGKGIMESLSAANDQAKKQMEARDVLTQRLEEFKKNPTQATVRAVGDAAAMASAAWAGGEALDAIAPETGAAGESTLSPEFTAAKDATQEAAVAKEPGIVRQVLKGEKVAQPGAQQAVRQAVQASTEAAGTADESMAAHIEDQPLLKGHETIVDKHLDALQAQEKAAYSKMDEAAGFDVKAEKLQLSNDQYKLKQLGNTDADIAQKGKLIESINDSEARIADAEAKMKEAGVDPKSADAIHQQRMAGSDFKKALFKNTSADGQSVNVDGLLNAGKSLRATKYGDRLEQFFGSPEAADKFMADLGQMQKLGAHAIKVQKIASMVGKWIAGGLVGGTAAGLGYEVLKP
jgi:hypothetical protein